MNRATRMTAQAVAIVGALLGVFACAVLLDVLATPAWLSRQELGSLLLAYLVILVLGGDPSRRPHAIGAPPA